MHTIHKQILYLEDEQEIEVPYGSKFLSAHLQRDDICIWYACDTSVSTRVKRKIYIRGTGHPVKNPTIFLGTIIMMGGDLVWHVLVGE